MLYTIANGAPPVGSTFAVQQTGAGAVTMQAESGVTFDTSKLTTNEQYDWLVCVHLSTNTWSIIGGVA